MKLKVSLSLEQYFQILAIKKSFGALSKRIMGHIANPELRIKPGISAVENLHTDGLRSTNTRFSDTCLVYIFIYEGQFVYACKERRSLLKWGIFRGQFALSYAPRLFHSLMHHMMAANKGQTFAKSNLDHIFMRWCAAHLSPRQELFKEAAQLDDIHLVLIDKKSLRKKEREVARVRGLEA